MTANSPDSILAAPDTGGGSSTSVGTGREAARVDLESELRARSQFLAKLSHEIRSPLSAVLGFSELAVDQIKDGGSPNPEHIRKINAAGKNILSILDTTMTISLIDAGVLQLSPALIDVDHLIATIRNDFQDAAAARSNTLRLGDTSPVGTFALDGARLREVIEALLSNAVRFTEKGTVTLAARARVQGRETWLDIAVSDTGVGIPPAEQGAIFDPFVRLNPKSRTAYGGTGLGLTLARKLVTLMRGTIAVQSTPAQGSTFTITVPAVPASSASAIG